MWVCLFRIRAKATAASTRISVCVYLFAFGLCGNPIGQRILYRKKIEVLVLMVVVATLDPEL